MNFIISATALVFGVAFASTASAFAPTTPVALNVVMSTTRRLRRPSQISMVADNAKVCLVTGASRGLGAAIALELGKHGQKLVELYSSRTLLSTDCHPTINIEAMPGNVCSSRVNG